MISGIFCLTIVQLLWDIYPLEGASDVSRTTSYQSVHPVPVGHVEMAETGSEMDENYHLNHSNSASSTIPTTKSQTTVAQEYDEKFINCAHAPVEKGNYERLSNGSVFVPTYNRIFNSKNYVINADDILFICPEFWKEHHDYSKYSGTLEIVTTVGTSISAICIVLHLIMFSIFEKLRNLPGYCLISLCKALLLAYNLTLLQQISASYSLNILNCTAVGIIKQFAFLASFFWMNVMSYDIWRSLRMATAKLRLTGDRPILTRFAMYSTYAWGVPLLIVILGLIIDTTNVDVEYKLLMGEDHCWFAYKQALLLYFALPLFVLLSLNILLFMSSIYMIRSATMNTTENRADLWSRFVVSIRLAVVMGLMWIFGILAAATDAEWLAYLNVVCSTLQGVFIFFSFTFTDNVRREWRRKKSSVTPTQTSSTHQSTSV